MTTQNEMQRRSNAKVRKWDICIQNERHGRKKKTPWRVQYKIDQFTYSPEQYFETWKEAISYVNDRIKAQSWYG